MNNTNINQSSNDINVLNFLNDTAKVSNNSSLPSKKNIKIYIIVGIIIVLLGIIIACFVLKDDSIPEAQINSSKITVTLNDDNVFFVDKEVIVSNINNKNSLSFSYPVTNDSVVENVEFRAENTEIYISEEGEHRYYVLQNKEKKITNNKKFIFHYEQTFPNMSLENIDFVLLDTHSELSNFRIIVNLNNKDYEDYEYQFNKDIDCTYDKTKISCFVDKLEANEKLYMSFKKKEVKELSPSSDYMKEYLLPVTILNNNNLETFKVGDYVNISSEGLNNHSELNGIIIRNVRILKFMDSSGEVINSNEPQKISYVVVELTDEMARLLSSVPYRSEYLILCLESTYNFSTPKATIENNYITDFISSASF